MSDDDADRLSPMGLENAVATMFLIAPAARKLEAALAADIPHVSRLRAVLHALADLGPTAPVRFVALAHSRTLEQEVEVLKSGSDLVTALARALAANPLGALLGAARAFGIIPPTDGGRGA